MRYQLSIVGLVLLCALRSAHAHIGRELIVLMSTEYISDFLTSCSEEVSQPASRLRDTRWVVA